MKTKRLLHGIFEFNCLYMYTHVYSFRSFLFIGVSKKVFLFVEAPLSTNKKFFIVRLCRNFSSRHLLILFNKRNTSSILRFVLKKFFHSLSVPDIRIISTILKKINRISSVLDYFLFNNTFIKLQ